MALPSGKISGTTVFVPNHYHFQAHFYLVSIIEYALFRYLKLTKYLRFYLIGVIIYKVSNSVMQKKLPVYWHW